MAWATWPAVKDPLNLSGAIKMLPVPNGADMLFHQHQRGGCIVNADGQVTELLDVVQRGPHGNVRDPFQDDFHDHGHAVFCHELLCMFEGCAEVFWVFDTQCFTAESFGHFEVVDPVSGVTAFMRVGCCVDVFKGQGDFEIHVEGTLRLPDEPQVGVINHDVDIWEVMLCSDGEFLNHELEVVVTGKRHHGLFRSGSDHAQCGRSGPPQWPCLAGVDPVAWRIRVQHLCSGDLAESNGRDVGGLAI